MSEYQVSQEHYPEYQHQHRIPDQPVLGEECDKAKEPGRSPREYGSRRSLVAELILGLHQIRVLYIPSHPQRFELLHGCSVIKHESQTSTSHRE